MTALDETWRVPATAWAAVLERYTSYLQIKTWRAKAFRSDGSETVSCITAGAAARLQKRLCDKVEPLLDGHLLSRQAYPLVATDIDALLVAASHPDRRFDRCPKWLWHVWRALVFNRDAYTCQYCLRTAWDAYADLGRTLRFELDHRMAKARLARRDDFDPTNILVACRSCNVVKGQMDVDRFLLELRSLAEAVVRNGGSAPKEAV